jgi:hypothetical protein
MKFDIGDFHKKKSPVSKPNLFEIPQKFRELHMKTHVTYIVAGETKSPFKKVTFDWNGIRLLGHQKMYNKYRANAPQCYVICKLPILFKLNFKEQQK